MSNPRSLEAQSDFPKVENEVEKVLLVGWDDPIASQLEELLLYNLHVTLRSAVKKIAECGYSEEVAETAVLSSGLYHGTKDPVLNIVDGALIFLGREKEFDTSKRHIFGDLENLGVYLMLEMINVLQEVKPSLTIPDAMWLLLICDLNLSHACVVEGDPLSGLGGKEMLTESSSKCTMAQLKSDFKTSEGTHGTPNSKCISEDPAMSGSRFWSEMLESGALPELSNSMSSFLREMRASANEALDSVPDSEVKECSVTSKRDILRKSIRMERSYKGHMSKGSFRAKITSWSGLAFDKKTKCSANSCSVNMKNASSKRSTAAGENVPATDNAAKLPTQEIASSAKPDASLPQETKPTSKPESNVTETLKTCDFCAGIPYNKSLRKYVPQDAHDRVILALVSELQVHQKELQGLTDWATEKVMQAAQRLRKDQAELKVLRREKEEAVKVEKDKQIVEESAMKRVSEMETALANAGIQVDMNNSTARRYEEENSMLKKKMEAARLQALGSAAKMQEALLREQDTLKKAQSWEKEKCLLQEMVSAEKRKVAQLQVVLERAKGRYNQTEAQRKQAEKAKEKLLNEASSISKEREQQESLARAEEDMIRQKAENEMQKRKVYIKMLQSKLLKIRSDSESSTIAALRRGDESIKSSSVLQDKFVSLERECVMCLTEEISVVFLPCAHQALCRDCNELHQKQGMIDCPSCRTPIQRRINVRFASP